MALPKQKSLVDFAFLLEDDKGFSRLAAFLQKKTGIRLSNQSKSKTFLASRLHIVMQNHGISDYSSYLNLLQTKPDEYLQNFINALTTNKTHFYREPAQLEYLGAHIMEYVKGLQGRHIHTLRCWSAACSYGQEPYSILMTIADNLDYPFETLLLATDIDRKALSHASKGVYPATELRQISSAVVLKHFSRLKDDPSHVVVNRAIRDQATFAMLNLCNADYGLEHPFDFIFCRNVMIYFSEEDRARIMVRFAKQLRIGGYCFVGLTESGVTAPENLKKVGNGIFQRVE